MIQNENKSSFLDENNFQGNIPQNPRKNIRTMSYENLLRQLLERLSSEYQQRLQSILSHKDQTKKESMIESLTQIRDEVNQCVLILVFEVQQYPPEPQHLQPRKKNNNQTRPNPENQRNNALRNIALNRLINKIEQSGKLFVTGIGNHPKELYNHAKQETWLYVSRNIHNYDPSQGLVMTWVNAHLEYRFQDAIANYIQEQERINNQIPLDAPLNDESKKPSIENFTPPIKGSFLSEQVYEYIEEDHTGLFQSTHIGENTEANLQTIILRMRTETVRSIAADFGLKETRVYSFIDRSLSRFGLLIDIDIKYLELVCEYIKQDSEGLFRQRYIKGYPHANFQELMLRILNGENFIRIAIKWQISEQKVYKFIKNNLKKFAPMIRKYINEHQN